MGIRCASSQYIFSFVFHFDHREKPIQCILCMSYEYGFDYTSNIRMYTCISPPFNDKDAKDEIPKLIGNSLQYLDHCLHFFFLIY